MLSKHMHRLLAALVALVAAGAGMVAYGVTSAVAAEPAAAPVLLVKAGLTEAEYQARASATCPTNRACVWSGYWDAADQGSLWYYTYAQLQAGVSWEGTAADLSTSSWYNRLTPIGTAGAPYMLMATNASCSTTSGRYVRLASQQVANGRNPATNWDNAYRSVFTQPPSAC